jgi:hypothetical protein
MKLSFLRRKTDRAQFPKAHSSSAPVSVTTPKPHRWVIDNEPAPLEFTRDPLLAAQIRNNLPNRPVSHELRACRMAAVLDRLASFLEDETGDVSMPEKPEAIKALRFGAEHLRDGIVIGGAP